MQVPPPGTKPAGQQQKTPAGFTEINYPMLLEDQFVQKGPNGQVSLMPGVEAKLLQPGMFVTTQDEVQKLILKTKNQAAPPGTHPELNVSHPSRLIGKLETGVMFGGQFAGGIGALNLIHPSAMSTFWHGFVPTHIAALTASRLADAGGGLSMLMGFKQAKDAFNKKAQYELLKTQGETTVEVEMPTPQGKQKVAQPIDVAIRSERDKAVSGLLMSGTGVCMLVAGFGVGGPYGVMAAGLMWKVGIAASLVQQREQLVTLGKMIGQGVNGYVDKTIGRAKHVLLGIDPLRDVENALTQALGNLPEAQKAGFKQAEERAKSLQPDMQAKANIAGAKELDPRMVVVSGIMDHCRQLAEPIEQAACQVIAPQLNPKDANGHDKSPEDMHAELQAAVEHHLLGNEDYQKVLSVFTAGNNFQQEFAKYDADNVLLYQMPGRQETVVVPPAAAGGTTTVQQGVQHLNAALAGVGDKWVRGLFNSAAGEAEHYLTTGEATDPTMIYTASIHDVAKGILEASMQLAAAKVDKEQPKLAKRDKKSGLPNDPKAYEDAVQKEVMKQPGVPDVFQVFNAAGAVLNAARAASPQPEAPPVLSMQEAEAQFNHARQSLSDANQADVKQIEDGLKATSGGADIRVALAQGVVEYCQKAAEPIERAALAEMQPTIKPLDDAGKAKPDEQVQAELHEAAEKKLSENDAYVKLVGMFHASAALLQAADADAASAPEPAVSQPAATVAPQPTARPRVVQNVPV